MQQNDTDITRPSISVSNDAQVQYLQYPSTKSWTRDKKILYFINDDLTPIRRSKIRSKVQSSTDKTIKLHQIDHRRETRHIALLDETNHNEQASSSNTTSKSTVIGHYELKKTLGKGNFSTVKLAQHRIVNYSVAIKIVKVSVLSEDNLMKVNREIDVLKKIGNHEHIVKLYQVIKTKRYFMLVIEYCANGELYDYLIDKGKLSESQSCNFFLQILSAIEYLHNHNIVHRDLKAENLLLTNDYKTVKIADFGFANYFKNDKLLSTWCGSPPYAAPELFKGLYYSGPPVDIWSLGVILYVLVCGSLPFDGPNLVYLKSRVLLGRFRIPFFMSTECESIIRGMLRLDPERRFNIRQIRSHAWIQKYGQSNQYFTNEPNIKPPSDRTYNPSLMRLCSATEQELDVSMSSGSNRGQSLDLDDEKKESLKEDASMTCLTNSIDGKSNRLSPDRKTGIVTNIHNFVNTEIANAVSSMSLDSNNSSMSVSQSVDTSSSSHPLSSRFGYRREYLSKQGSIDNHIIDFMVEKLHVSDNHTSIRQAIANEKYDDLHAIYRIIKDQPSILSDFDTQFKVPSLPLISSNISNTIKKPSITSGHINILTETKQTELSTVPPTSMTQSSLIPQLITTEPRGQVNQAKFITNNLINQNYVAMDNLALQDNISEVPKLNLLDPNCLSSFERRASDGQASYSSLTHQANIKQSTAPNESSTANINPALDPINFLSSSSNQLSTNMERNFSGQTFFNQNTNGLDSSSRLDSSLESKSSSTTQNIDLPHQDSLIQQSPLDLSMSSKGDYWFNQ